MLNDPKAMPVWGIHCATLPFTPTYTRITYRTRWTNILPCNEDYIFSLRAKSFGELEQLLAYYVPDYGYTDERVQAIIAELRSRGYYLKPHTAGYVSRLLGGERVTMCNPDYGVAFDIVPLATNAPGGYNGYAHCPPGSPRPRHGYRAMNRERLTSWVDSLEPVEGER